MQYLDNSLLISMRRIALSFNRKEEYQLAVPIVYMLPWSEYNL